MPQGICLRIKQGDKYKKILFNKKPILGFHKIYFSKNNNFYSDKNAHSYFSINFNLKKLTIVNIKRFVLSKKRKGWEYFENENSKYEKIKNEFTNRVNINSLKKIGSNYKNIKTFPLKSELMINKFNYLDKDNNIANKKKNYLIKRNETISEITDANISFHALISTNGFLIEESIKNSIWDNYFIKNNENLYLPNITRAINSTCLIFPTASNHLSHYVSESLIRLSYVNDLEKIKIIVYDKIAPYLVKIITAYGIKRNQIIKKPTFETWNVKKLIFPSINWFEISKKESIYLSEKIIRKKNYKNNNFKKIYISRTDAKENRNLINEKEIENYLSKKGFKIIIASKLSLYEKINIIENAEVVITALGSALYNFLFCKNIKAKVVLIGTKRFLIRDFLQFSYLKNIQLFFLKATEIPSYSKQWQYQVSSFFIEIKKLKILLKKLDKFS